MWLDIQHGIRDDVCSMTVMVISTVLSIPAMLAYIGDVVWVDHLSLVLQNRASFSFLITTSCWEKMTSFMGAVDTLLICFYTWQTSAQRPCLSTLQRHINSKNVLAFFLTQNRRMNMSNLGAPLPVLYYSIYMGLETDTSAVVWDSMFNHFSVHV